MNGDRLTADEVKSAVVCLESILSDVRKRYEAPYFTTDSALLRTRLETVLIVLMKLHKEKRMEDMGIPNGAYLLYK